MLHLIGSLFEIKIITLTILFVGTFLASGLPWLVAKKVQNAIVFFSVLNCLAGGVVVGAAFSHMLPEAQRSLNSFFLPHDTYPYTFLAAACSLMMLISIDLLLLDSNHSHSEIPESYKQIQTVGHNSGSSSNGEEEEGEIVSNEGIGYGTDHMDKKSSGRALVFLVALGMHSLFEGLGLGAAETYEGVYSVMLAVISHKLLEAFALGLSIYYANFTTFKNFFLLLLYALATPVGIAAGIGAGDIKGDGVIISGILTAVAAGSFFYISLYEIIPTELHKPEKKKTKLVMMFLGWGIMAFLAKYA